MGSHLSKGRFSRPVDRNAVAADWRARGFSCDLFVDPPGRAWLEFVHGVDEVVTIADGRLEVTVGGERILAEPGDEIYIPRGVVHSVRNIHGGMTHWLYGYA